MKESGLNFEEPYGHYLALNFVGCRFGVDEDEEDWESWTYGGGSPES